MDTNTLVRLYIEEQASIIKTFPVEAVARVVDRVVRAYDEGGTVYACGNGGNAAFAANFIADLAFLPFVSDDKTNPLPSSVKRIQAVNLSDSPTVITGILNDSGPEYIFSQQLEGHVGPKDVLFGFSGSGNSANIIKAFETAKRAGASTIGITRGNGGKTREITDICVIIPGTSRFPGQIGKNNNNFHFEDYLSSIPHMIAGILQKHVRQTYGVQPS